MSLPQFKKFWPSLGLAVLFLFFVLLITVAFNYYNPNSAAWIHGFNPFYLLIRWDSLHYLDLAVNGPREASVFFPLYPLLVRGLSLFISPVLAGFLISFIALVFALYYFRRLLEGSGYGAVSNRVILLLLAFPTAVFFPLIYTEALFLSLTIAFFFYAHKRQWLIVAIIGFFACLTRNVGIFLWPVYLTFVYISLPHELIRNRLKALLQKKETWLSLLIPAGLVVYCIYNYVQFGDFFGFISGQKNWDAWRSFMWPWQTAIHYCQAVFSEPLVRENMYSFVRSVLVEGGSFILLVAVTVYWFVKKQWPYAVFCLLHALLFACMFPMLSVNRYVAVIFPIFICLGEATKKRDWLFYALATFFFIFLVFNVYLFSVGAWVG